MSRLPNGKRRDQGVSLLEIMIAMVVLVIALLGLMSVMTYTTRLNATNRENLAALRGAEKMMETMRSVPFNEIFARYNDVDDPAIPGAPPLPGKAPPPGATEPGPYFNVEGVDPDPTSGSPDPDGPSGHITFPGTNGQLREDLTGAFLGLPNNIDLNGDGVIDSNNHATDYKLLPVQVTISWSGIQGRRTLTYRHMFMQR